MLISVLLLLYKPQYKLSWEIFLTSNQFYLSLSHPCLGYKVSARALDQNKNLWLQSVPSGGAKVWIYWYTNVCSPLWVKILYFPKAVKNTDLTNMAPNVLYVTLPSCPASHLAPSPHYTLCFSQTELFVELRFLLFPLTSIRLHILYPLPQYLPFFICSVFSGLQVTLCLVKPSFTFLPSIFNQLTVHSDST